MQSVFRFFLEIPAAFWGVVFGSFISIFGLALTNRANDKRLQKQFDNERESKRTDREMTLRKDIFLSASEAVSAGINSIGKFSNLKLTNEEVVAGYIEKIPLIAKVHVIARTDTVLRIAQFSSQLTTIQIDLFSQRQILLDKIQSLSELDRRITQANMERDQSLELIRQYNMAGINDQKKWIELQENFENEQRSIRNYLAEHRKIEADIKSRHIELAQECLLRTEQLAEAIIPLVSSMRNELELPLDMEAYRRVLMENYSHQKQTFKKYADRTTSDSTASTT